MGYKIRIVTSLINDFEEIVDLKDFTKERVLATIESTKKQLTEGIETDKDGIKIHCDFEVIWEDN